MNVLVLYFLVYNGNWFAVLSATNCSSCLQMMQGCKRVALKLSPVSCDIAEQLASQAGYARFNGTDN